MYVRFEVIQIQLIPDNNVPRLPVLLAFYSNAHSEMHTLKDSLIIIYWKAGEITHSPGRKRQVQKPRGKSRTN